MSSVASPLTRTSICPRLCFNQFCTGWQVPPHYRDGFQRHICQHSRQVRLLGRSGSRITGMSISRRRLLVSAAAYPARAQNSAKRKIVIAGGHPGDPECGCAGSIARFTDLGHDVVLLYLNHGEGYCGTAPLKQCASVRTAQDGRPAESSKRRPPLPARSMGSPSSTRGIPSVRAHSFR